jgi:hypothetical protein
MQRQDVQELHYLTAIANLASIEKFGILSHERASRLPNCVSIANQEVQDRRKAKAVPMGRPLHQYVNLYLNGRNPMMYCQLGVMDTVCVVRVDPAVLDLPNVVITDRNAAADLARFAASPQGLAHVDQAVTFARYWTHPGDPIAEKDHKQRMCVEVLVPDAVDATHILGCHVRGPIGMAAVSGQCKISVTVKRDLFFS